MRSLCMTCKQAQPTQSTDQDYQNMMPAKRGRKKKPKKWSKPEGMPKKPLSAYNLFFSLERRKLLAEKRRLESKDDHPQAGASTGELNQPDAAFDRERSGKDGIGFAYLARSVASKWKSSSAEDKQPFYEEAARELKRYKAAVKEWQALGLDPRVSKRRQQKMYCSGTTKGTRNDQSNSDRGCLSFPEFRPKENVGTYFLKRQQLPDLDVADFQDCLALHVESLDFQDSNFCFDQVLDSGVDSVNDHFKVIDKSWRPLQPNPILFQQLNLLQDSAKPDFMDFSAGVKSQNRAPRADYGDLSSRLFQELNSSLDQDQIVFLKETFARSA